MATLGAYLGLGMHLAHRNSTQTIKIQYKHSPLVVRATTAEAPEAATAVEEKPRQAIPGTRRKKLIIPRLRGEYLQKIVPQLRDEFNYENIHQIPKLDKIVVNCGIGDEAQNAKTLEMVTKELAEITGQWPIKTRAKKPIASFKIKKGSIVGLTVTLRGKLMYDFVDRIINVALPRSRDFQGVSPYAFDGNGNYNLGINDHSMFPEIDAETVDKRRGMNISISTTAKTDNEAYKLLYHMGMPFNDGVSNF